MIFCIALNICILAFGAVSDYKRREIPDFVPLILIMTGIISNIHTGWEVVLFRIGALLLTAVVFLLSAKITKSDIPGGDFKLLCALAFSAGLPVLLIVLLLTGLCAVFVGSILKQPVQRHIPLCSYIAPAYSLLCMIILIL